MGFAKHLNEPFAGHGAEAFPDDILVRDGAQRLFPGGDDPDPADGPDLFALAQTPCLFHGGDDLSGF